MACLRAFPRRRCRWAAAAPMCFATCANAPADFVLIGLTFVDLDGVDVLHGDRREQLARRVMIVGPEDEHSFQALRTARFDAFFDPFVETVDNLVAALRQVAEGTVT